MRPVGMLSKKISRGARWQQRQRMTAQQRSLCATDTQQIKVCVDYRERMGLPLARVSRFCCRFFIAANVADVWSVRAVTELDDLGPTIEEI